MMLQDCNRCPNHSNSMLTSTGTNTDPLVNRVKGFLRSENVHKDIGYSSDAELSDAVDVRKNPAETTGDASAPVSLTSSSAVIVSNLSPSNSCRSSSQGRKRVIKRRQRSRDVKLSPSSSTGCLSMTSKRRPWSFHAASEWTDWDYYQPPSFAITAADHHPSDDLYINDENAIRSLIEFGENYEHWFRTDDGCVGLRASTPIQDSQDLLTGNNGRLRPPHHKCDCGRNATATPGAAGSETDTGKSSGCCLSDGEESNYSGEELEHDREASLAYSPLVANNRISFMTSEAGTECPSQVTNDAGTITTSISMCDSSTCTDLLVVPEEEEEIQSKPIISSPAAPVPRSRRPSSSFAYMIFFAFSIVSLFVSIFFADRPPHVQLSFTTPPPV